VHRILESDPGKSWLAYLSACSTAENRVSELADEALHLASGFQVAGFRQTVASMWLANDEICAQVASIFYRFLFNEGLLQQSDRAVVEALHAAVKDIRAQHADRPYLWAQYVHYGA
jgi:CHAT domain-containing protein